ncbi:hypothetical protein L1987_15076 [Smallanthus sonchifolius]|uniref:Uncharacterized protein n=1 Tax=Smallanthus sonchifolius TaxID=185202 RepID=A0ACB9J4H4_9ASTR|nr:hypothetical protein L1987_15076 [Smallanthus sonchifolius]
MEDMLTLTATHKGCLDNKLGVMYRGNPEWVLKGKGEVSETRNMVTDKKKNDITVEGLDSSVMDICREINSNFIGRKENKETSNRVEQNSLKTVEIQEEKRKLDQKRMKIGRKKRLYKMIDEHINVSEEKTGYHKNEKKLAQGKKDKEGNQPDAAITVLNDEEKLRSLNSPHHMFRSHQLIKHVFVQYLRMWGNGKAEKIKASKINRLKLGWKTMGNIKDYGIFAMRHMEMFMGINDKVFDCGFSLSESAE